MAWSKEELEGYVKSPNAKTLSMTFKTDSKDVAQKLFIELHRVFSGFGQCHIGMYPGEELECKKVAFQVDVLEYDFWSETLEIAYEFMEIGSKQLIDMGFEYGQVEFLDADIYGIITIEEALMFRKFSGFTAKTKRVMLNTLTEIAMLKQQLESFQDEIRGLKIYNSQVVHTNSLLQLITRLANHVGFDEDDFIQQSFVTVQ